MGRLNRWVSEPGSHAFVDFVLLPGVRDTKLKIPKTCEFLNERNGGKKSRWTVPLSLPAILIIYQY